MSTSPSTLSPALEPPRTRRRRWPVPLGVAVGLVAVFVLVASLVTAPYTELVPGDALPVDTLISVPSGLAHPHHGRLFLTDVGVNTLRYIAYFYTQLFPDPKNDVVPTGDLTSNLPLSEFNAQGTVDMAESQLTAEAVALRQLGYAVVEHDVGVTIYVIAPGSPAARALSVGDVVTSIDGTPTTNPQALVAAVRSHRPGETVTVRVGSIAHPTPGRAVSVKLSSRVEGGKKVAFIGIGDPSDPLASQLSPMGTQPAYDFPFKVGINTDNIGGPSAGLAFTLGIVNTLGGGNVTGGLNVAATGTIRPDGSVGDVGGVKQKTVAVEDAGATVFLVPKTPGDTELKLAESVAGPKLKVYAVGSVGEALADLEHLGGVVGGGAQGPPAGPGGHSVPTDWQQSPWT